MNIRSTLQKMQTTTCTACMAILIACCQSSMATATTTLSPRIIPGLSSTESGRPDLNDTALYHQGGYTVRFISNDADFDTAMRMRLVRTFFAVYPREVARFNPGSMKTVTFFIDTAYHDIAGTANGIIVFNPAYCKKYPDDLDMVTHEAMHIVQDYPGGPGWITEGIADYARYKYGLHNEQAGWTVQPYSLTVDYTAGYGQAAHFLLWLEAFKNKHIVDILNKAMHENKYQEAIWIKTTGQTLPELWKAYGKNPVLPEESVSVKGAKDLSCNSRILVFRENKGGFGSPESSFMLNDSNIKSKYLIYGFTKGLWLQLNLSGPAMANSYLLTSGNDQNQRDPSDWILAGSQDGQHWTTLDQRTGQHFSRRSTTYQFDFKNQTPYPYYRLIIQKTAGSPDFQLSEWRMLQKN